MFQVPLAQAKGAAPCAAAGQHRFGPPENAVVCWAWSSDPVSLRGPRGRGTRDLAARLAAGPVPAVWFRWRLSGVSVGPAAWVGCRTCAVRMLAQWFSSTRLGTRTKESNTYASGKVANLGRVMKVTFLVGSRKGALSTDHPRVRLSKSICAGTRKMVNYA